MSCGLAALLALSLPGTTPTAVSDPEGEPSILARFRGSVLHSQTSVSLNALAPALQLSSNPTVETALVIAPRYRVATDFELRGRLSLSYEWTSSDTTTALHELELSDASLGLMYHGIPSFLGDTKALVGLDVVLPLSKVSQARTMILAPGVSATLSHTFADTVELRGSGAYRRPWYEYSTAGLERPPAYARQCFGAELGCVDQASGVANVRDALSWSLVAVGSWGAFHATLWFDMTHQFPYGFQPLEGVSPRADQASVRVSTFASVAASYEFTDWVSAELSYSMARSLFNGDGSYGNPLFDANQDMRLNLGATLDVARFLD